MRKTSLLAAALLLAGFLGTGPVAAQDADTPLDRALQQVEALLSTLRATPNADPGLVKKLEEIAGTLREAKGAPKGGGGPGGGSPPLPSGIDENIYRITFETFLTNTDLKEDGKTAADVILREFVADYALARKHEDDKSKGVVRDHTEGRIGRTFAQRDANKLKDNLDTIIKRWEWAGGRGGRGGR